MKLQPPGGRTGYAVTWLLIPCRREGRLLRAAWRPRDLATFPDRDAAQKAIIQHIQAAPTGAFLAEQFAVVTARFARTMFRKKGRGSRKLRPGPLWKGRR